MANEQATEAADRYTITVNREQALVLSMATELLARIGMGQLSDVREHTPTFSAANDEAMERTVALADGLRALEPLATGMARNAHPSISSAAVPRSGKVAWDLHSAIRHRLAWDAAGNPPERDWSRMLGVQYDEPTNYSSLPMATVARHAPQGGDAEWIATAWATRAQFNDLESDRVEIVRMNSPFYDGERYAVRRLSKCLNRDGKWEREPMPSSRDDAFYDRCRFRSFDAAIAAIRKAESPAAPENGGGR